MSDYWIKLYTEILDDPKMGVLPDRLWRRVIELFLLAGKLCADKSGLLPDTKQLAWLLRLPADELEQDLNELTNTGIIQKTNNGWLVVNFKKRQEKSDVSERVRRYRERTHRKQYYNETDTHSEDHTNNDVTEAKQNVTNDVTQMKRNVTQINRNRLTETETESEAAAAAIAQADEKSAKIPKKPPDPLASEQPQEPKTVVDQDIGGIYREYESNFGALTPLIAERLGDLADHYPRDWISAAFREAVTHEARNLKYVEAILKRWKREGFQSSHPKPRHNGKNHPQQQSEDPKYTPEQIYEDLYGEKP